MKKTIFALAMLLALEGSVPALAQRHRHTPRTTVVDGQSDKRQPAAGGSHADDKNGSSADDKNTEGIEAYSDTSSVPAVADTATYMPADQADDYNRFSPKHFDDPLSWFAYLCSSSFWGVAFTILFVVLFLLVLLSPLIIVLLIIRYIIRRHNDRVRLAEKAMENGQPFDEQMPLSRRSPEFMWRRGVKNTSIGVGLMLFFWFLGTESLVGIGGLIACMGAGQMFMARHNYNGRIRPDDTAADTDGAQADAGGFGDFQNDMPATMFGGEGNGNADESARADDADTASDKNRK